MSDLNNIVQLDQMPVFFRVVNVSACPIEGSRNTRYRVELYHEKVGITVSFMKSHPDTRLKENALVGIWWKRPVLSVGGAVQISRLSIIEQPSKGFDLFATVPESWVKDRALIKRAQTVMKNLPDNMRQLINAILWNGNRFKQFCKGPSSVSGHHSFENGNLLHTIEVTEMVQLNAPSYPQANLGISMAAAMLHDLGKADEYYQWKNGWGMTDRGKLIGHRHTIIEWIAQARANNRINIQENHYLSLMHALTSGFGAEFLGIRSPTTPEATLLNIADRLSGESSLTAMVANMNGGWGAKHHHRKNLPYTVPNDGQRQSTGTKAVQYDF